MPRPYRDAAELVTDPVDRDLYVMVPEGSIVVRGIAFPGVEEPVPLVLMPGYDYRLRTVSDERRSDPIWIIERRRAATGIDDD
jgi:hypothetical protein